MRKDNMGWAFQSGRHLGRYPKFSQAKHETIKHVIIDRRWF